MKNTEEKNKNNKNDENNYIHNVKQQYKDAAKAAREKAKSNPRVTGRLNFVEPEYLPDLNDSQQELIELFQGVSMPSEEEFKAAFSLFPKCNQSSHGYLFSDSDDEKDNDNNNSHGNNNGYGICC